LVGTWNGASYYIEIFSKRYNLKFEAEEKTRNERPRVEKEKEKESSKENNQEVSDFN